MNGKKTYAEPELEIIEIREDILTDSLPDDEWDN